MSVDPNERFADWVDGRLSPRDLARFEAELTASAEFRRRAEEYRTSVDWIRSALDAPLTEAEGGPADLADRVMAAVAAPRAQHTSRRWAPYLLSAAVAATVIGGVFVLQQMGLDRSPRDDAPSMAKADPDTMSVDGAPPAELGATAEQFELAGRTAEGGKGLVDRMTKARVQAESGLSTDSEGFGPELRELLEAANGKAGSVIKRPEGAAPVAGGGEPSAPGGIDPQLPARTETVLSAEAPVPDPQVQSVAPSADPGARRAPGDAAKNPAPSNDPAVAGMPAAKGAAEPSPVVGPTELQQEAIRRQEGGGATGEKADFSMARGGRARGAPDGAPARSQDARDKNALASETRADESRAKDAAEEAERMLGSHERAESDVQADAFVPQAPMIVVTLPPTADGKADVLTQELGAFPGLASLPMALRAPLTLDFALRDAAAQADERVGRSTTTVARSQLVLAEGVVGYLAEQDVVRPEEVAGVRAFRAEGRPDQVQNLVRALSAWASERNALVRVTQVPVSRLASLEAIESASALLARAEELKRKDRQPAAGDRSPLTTALPDKASGGAPDAPAEVAAGAPAAPATRAAGPETPRAFTAGDGARMSVLVVFRVPVVPARTPADSQPSPGARDPGRK